MVTANASMIGRALEAYAAGVVTCAAVIVSISDFERSVLGDDLGLLVCRGRARHLPLPLWTRAVRSVHAGTTHSKHSGTNDFAGFLACCQLIIGPLHAGNSSASYSNPFPGLNDVAVRLKLHLLHRKEGSTIQLSLIAIPRSPSQSWIRSLLSLYHHHSE